MIGERIREARMARQMSLSEVAAKTQVSTATLSRIENGKQTIDVTLLLLLAKTLRTSASEFIGESQEGSSTVADRIVSLRPADRMRLWRELSETRRDVGDRMPIADIAQQLDECLAQIDLLRAEVERLRAALRSTHVRRR
jgi:transcriptional regulator with XRE-family HTH domain